MQSLARKLDMRKISRVIRLIMFLVAARGASRFATTTPRRACGRFPGFAYSTKCDVLCAGRKRKTDENSSVFTIRRSREKSSVTQSAIRRSQAKQPGACGPWRGAHSGCRGHYGSPCGHGNRGYACGALRKVDKYVSWGPRYSAGGKSVCCTVVLTGLKHDHGVTAKASGINTSGREP